MKTKNTDYTFPGLGTSKIVDRGLTPGTYRYVAHAAGGALITASNDLDRIKLKLHSDAVLKLQARRTELLDHLSYVDSSLSRLGDDPRNLAEFKGEEYEGHDQ